MTGGRRSQIMMSDLFLAASIFILLLGMMIFLYNHYTSKFESRQEFDRMQFSAVQLSDMLVKSEGLPHDWETNPNATLMVGLAHKENCKRNLSAMKVGSMVNMSYGDVKGLFGGHYDFYLMIESVNGSLIAETGKKSGSATAVSVERRVMYNDDSAILSLVLWRAEQ